MFSVSFKLGGYRGCGRGDYFVRIVVRDGRGYLVVLVLGDFYRLGRDIIKAGVR